MSIERLQWDQHNHEHLARHGAGDAESQALAAHPAVEDIFEEGRRNRAARRGIPAKEMYRRYGYRPPDERAEERQYNGRIMVRVSRSLHRDLIERAEVEGVSLNQLILTYLAREVGAAQG